MKNIIKSVGDILGLLAVPWVMPILSAAVIVWITGLYKGGSEDIIMVANHVSDIEDPMLIRLSCCLVINLKCCLSSVK